MWVRYLASIDDTVYGRTALAFLKGMLRHASVRLVPQTAPPSTAWAPYVAHLLTREAMSGPYVNVVCTPPDRWTWLHAVAAPTRSGTPEIIRGRLELYTAGVRNVLIAPTPPSDTHQVETARRYEAVIVHNEMDAVKWRGLEIETRMVNAGHFAAGGPGWELFTQEAEMTKLTSGPLPYYRPYDGQLCDNACDECGHKHCHDHTGQCLTGSPLPKVGEPMPPRCPCPYPHGIQKKTN